MNDGMSFTVRFAKPGFANTSAAVSVDGSVKASASKYARQSTRSIGTLLQAKACAVSLLHDNHAQNMAEDQLSRPASSDFGGYA